MADVDDLDLLFKEGYKYYWEGDFKKAYQFFDKSIRKKGEFYLKTYYKALSLIYQGKLIKSLPLFEKTLEQKQDFIKCFIALATVYQRLGKNGNALQVLNDALDLDKEPTVNERLEINQKKDKILDSLKKHTFFNSNSDYLNNLLVPSNFEPALKKDKKRVVSTNFIKGNMLKTFKVNEFLSLKLELTSGATWIYVKGESFWKLSEPERKNQNDGSTEFLEHCSNLKAWYENDYDTRLFHSHLAFPLLLKLKEQGDPKAVQVFEKEIIKRLESNHLPTLYSFLEDDYLKYLNKDDLENLLTRLLSILDYENLENYEKFDILETITTKSKDEKIHNFYKSEIIKSFQEGRLDEIVDILYDIYEERITIFRKDDIKELYSYFDFNHIKQKEFEEITHLLWLLSLVDLADSEIYKKIVKIEIENEVPLEKIINFLILEKNLKIFSKEELESLNLKKLTIYRVVDDGEIDKDIPEEIGYIKLLEELDFVDESRGEQFAILPDSIQNLENLKYLDLRCVMSFPNSIKKLKNLKTITLPSSSGIFELPEWIDQLKWVEMIQFYIFLTEQHYIDGAIIFNLRDFFDIFNGSEINLIYSCLSSLQNQDHKNFNFPIDILELYSVKFYLTENKEHQLKIEHLIINLIDLVYQKIFYFFNSFYSHATLSFEIIDRTTELIGKNYSLFFKKIIENTLKDNNKSKIVDIILFKWLYLLKKEDFIKLLKDPGLNFLNILWDGHIWEGRIGREIDDIIFECVLDTISPSEAQGLRDIRLILNDSILPYKTGEEENAFEIENQHVVKLFLRENELDHLPDTIGNLVYLESLNLIGNKLKELPASFENLKSLKYLNLCSNKFETIPLSLIKLSSFHSLKGIEISQNKIKYIPHRFRSIIDEEDFEYMVQDEIGLEVTNFTELITAIKNTKFFSRKYSIYKTLFENVYVQLLDRNNILMNLPYFREEFSELIDSIRDTELINDYLPEIIDNLLIIDINTPGFNLNVITKLFGKLIKSITNTDTEVNHHQKIEDSFKEIIIKAQEVSDESYNKQIFFSLLDSFEGTNLIDTHNSEVEKLYKRIKNQLTEREIKSLNDYTHKYKFLY